VREERWEKEQGTAGVLVSEPESGERGMAEIVKALREPVRRELDNR
jgi:hypothetical protein